MYCLRWEEFCELSRTLVEESEKTRYCVRWRHDVGLLVLKVTNDEKCIKFKTRSMLFLNRFDLFTQELIERQQNQFTPPQPDQIALESKPVIESTKGKKKTQKKKPLSAVK